jgi:alkylhydroperoxidase family enzyme
MSRHDVVAFELDARVTEVAEVAISSAVGCRVCINFDPGRSCFEFLGMEDIENGAGVMNGWEGELVVVVIHNLELFEHVMDCFRKGNVLVSFEMI